ncbi:MAG TPA: DUF4214 domain-containing protein [Pirellulales bacterium]|nr:DUF4214 domain-containing protein [Pirellulales bacterium]
MAIVDSADSTTATATSTATVADADVLAPGFVTAGDVPEGTFVGGSAAVFSDTGFKTNSTADFTGSFAWGDGTTFTTGNGNATITSNGAGNFTLSVSAHSYADEGTYTVKATLTDGSPGTASLTQTGTLTATEADAFTPATSPLTLTATEGTSVSGNVAVFADTGYPNSIPADLSATIHWGDGTTTAGTVTTTGNGSFTVSGNHTYAEDGSYTVSASIADNAAGTATATTTATAHIAEADLTLTPSFATLNATEGTLVTGVVAHISDVGSADPATDYSATIDWGDGTITAGTVTGASGSYTVSTVSGHTYGQEGSYTVTVTATETSAVPTATAKATLVADVADADVLALSSFANFSATEGQTATATAIFSHTGYAANPAGDFTATVAWGDGTSSVGTVTGSAGSFTVSGSHRYAEEGPVTATIVLSDKAPGTATGTAVAALNVADAALSVVGTTIAPMEGSSFTGVVANFTDADPAGTAADYTAAIFWGDGATTTGTVSANGAGFQVTGTHTYLEEGANPVRVVVSDAGGSAATANSTADVADAPLSATAAAITSPQFTNFSGVVATFTDANPKAASDFTATVDWGDGSSSAGTIAASGGGFKVSGSHAYAEDGTFAVKTTIADAGGGTATAGGTANITEQAISGTALAVNGFERSPLAQVALATFSHGNGNEPAGDFNATIHWGDGTSSTGSVSESGATYTVSGSHTYLDEGPFAIAVQVVDGGASATVTTSAKLTEELLPNGTVGTVNERFVQEVYRDLLHRPADAAGLSFWTGLRDQGESRLKVVTSFIAASMRGELSSDLVTGIYEKYLGREPDAGGLAVWTAVLSSGNETIEQVEANIAGSAEFYAQSGGTNDGFVTRLFNLALGRNPDPASLAGFNAALAAGTTRERLAELVFGSHEFHHDQIAGYYQSPSDTNGHPSVAAPFSDDLDFLDRPADSLGLSGFTAVLDLGVRDQVIWASMMASDEFFAKIA